MMMALRGFLLAKLSIRQCHWMVLYDPASTPLTSRETPIKLKKVRKLLKTHRCVIWTLIRSLS